jgi:hypothetical protein
VLDRLWGRLTVFVPARPDDPVVVAACGAGAEALGLALLRSATADDLAARRTPPDPAPRRGPSR